MSRKQTPKDYKLDVSDFKRGRVPTDGWRGREDRLGVGEECTGSDLGEKPLGLNNVWACLTFAHNKGLAEAMVPGLGLWLLSKCAQLLATAFDNLSRTEE